MTTSRPRISGRSRRNTARSSDACSRFASSDERRPLELPRQRRATRPTGFDAEAVDGDIGTVDGTSLEAGAGYLVIDTGRWIFWKEGAPSRPRSSSVPIATTRRCTSVGRRPRSRMHRVRRDHYRDVAYRERVGAYYAAAPAPGPEQGEARNDATDRDRGSGEGSSSPARKTRRTLSAGGAGTHGWRGSVSSRRESRTGSSASWRSCSRSARAARRGRSGALRHDRRPALRRSAPHPACARLRRVCDLAFRAGVRRTRRGRRRGEGKGKEVGQAGRLRRPRAYLRRPDVHDDQAAYELQRRRRVAERAGEAEYVRRPSTSPEAAGSSA